MRNAIAAIWLVVCLGQASADEQPCAIPSSLMTSDNDLKQVSASVREHHLNIAVVGSGSSLISGPDGPRTAYPARLEETLGKRLPGIAVKVSAIAKSRETAEDMAKGFDQILNAEKPNLVVWQTGTVDAIKGVEPDDFKDVLEEGVEMLQAGGADVILMNMQYSPRTESMIATGPYADDMRVVAQQHGIPLFDRFAIMRHWSEVGQFDLHAASKDNALARRVHDCIGHAIASLIIDSAHLQAIESKITQ